MRLIVLILLCCSLARAEEPLPHEILAQIAEPNIAVVELPKGRFAWTTAGSAIVVNRSNLRLLCYGATLVQQVQAQGNFLQVRSDRAVDPWREGHLVGQITNTTDELIIGETDAPNVRTLTPGEVILVGAGVHSHDPNTPELQMFMTVKEVVGNVVKFTQPFNRTIRVWPSYDQINIESGGWQAYKVGDWGYENYLQKRGLGLDHGFMQFVGGKPVENVSIEGLTLEWNKDWDAVYGAHSMSAAFVRNVKFKDITIHNPRDSGLHLFYTYNSGIDGFNLFGRGDTNVYHLSGLHYTATAFTIWGGRDNYARNIYAEGRNQTLLNCEVNSINTTVERATMRTAHDTGYGSVTQFGIHGPHPGFSLKDIKLDIPTQSYCLLPGLAPAYLQMEDMSFEGNEIPDWIELSSHKWKGTIRVGKRVFGPFRRQTFAHTVTNADGNTQRIPIPSGLISRITLELDSREHVRDISSPNSVGWADSPPEQLVFNIEKNGRIGVAHGDIDNHISRVQNDTWIWYTPSEETFRIKVKVDVEGFFENN